MKRGFGVFVLRDIDTTRCLLDGSFMASIGMRWDEGDMAVANVEMRRIRICFEKWHKFGKRPRG